jgi:hypothetical protein
VPVKLEFLCDLPDYREGEVVRPRGCEVLSAQNLRGTGYVARGFAWERVSGVLPDGRKVTVRVRFAGLEGYLLSKCVAVRTRAATKDYYDLVYVMQHNRAGGPEEAAHRLLNGEFANDLDSLRTTFIEVRERYVRTADSGPTGYAEQAKEVEPDARCSHLAGGCRRCGPALLYCPRKLAPIRVEAAQPRLGRIWRSRRTRSSIGGWVEKRPAMPLPLKGRTM